MHTMKRRLVAEQLHPVSNRFNQSESTYMYEESFIVLSLCVCPSVCVIIFNFKNGTSNGVRGTV